MPRIIVPIPKGEEPPANRRISWWLENALIRSMKGFLNDARDTLRDILTGGVTEFVEETELDLIEIIRPFAQMLLDIPGFPEEVKSPIREAMTGKHQAGIAVILGLVGALIGALASGAMSPISRLASYAADSAVHSLLFDPPTLMAMRLREIISEAEYNSLMSMNGASVTTSQHLAQLARPLLSIAELTQMKWRGLLADGNVKSELGHYGYNPAQQNFLVELMEVIPSPSDLVAMAVREAFNDETASTFGYDEDYPVEAAQWAEKTGMKPVWFKRFWRAHWNLPGLVQVREMFNRGIIDENELNIYLRAADIPPFWRKSLSQWFKSEITRVDVRRIYSLGLIDTPDVYQRYLRLGYNEEDSALMTQWTAAQYLEADRELTKTDILSMYEDGILNEDETVIYLSALDFRLDAISLLMAQRDLQRQAAYEKQIIANVKKLFVAGVYGRNDVYAELGKLDTPASFIEQSLDVWDLDIKAKVSIPTTAQLRDLAQMEIISHDRFREEMSKRGYTDEYVDWYYQMWLVERPKKE